MDRPLLIAAASSFTDILPRIARKHQIEATFRFGASRIQARQIADGLPVDVFVCADETDIAPLEASGRVERPALRFATNTLVVIAPKPTSGSAPKGLLDPRLRRIAVPRPEGTPSGKAARAGLIRVKLWERIEPRVVYGATVRQTLDLVARGNADAGIVFRTDARSGAGRVVEIGPSPGAQPLRCAAGVLSEGTRKEDARAFVACLNTVASRHLLEKAGFGAA